MINNDEGVYTAETRDEYLDKLKQWLEEARLWHSVYTTNLSYSYPNVQSPYNINVSAVSPQWQSNTNFLVRHFKQYTIPPLWKRILAETIDFLILFAIKISLVLVTMEVFSALNIENFGMEAVQKVPQVAIQIAVLEVVQGVLALLYETYWLSADPGATLGKRYMGLAVIHVESIYSVPEQRVPTVLAYPCTSLGYKRAFMRSFMKHIFFAFMIPVFYVPMFLEFNRTGYDVFSNTVVVEYNPNPRTYLLR